MDSEKRAAVSSQETLVSVSSKKQRVWYKTPRRNHLIIVLVILAALALALLISTAVLSSHCHLSALPCTSDECINSAYRLQGSMDLTVSPCDDFYQFTCGRFARQHPVHFDTAFSHSWFTETSQDIDNDLIRILERSNTDSHDEEPHVVKSARNLYTSCMDKDRLDELGIKPVLEILEAVELSVPFPTNSSNFDLTRTLALLQKVIGMDVFLKLSARSKEGNITADVILHFDRPSVNTNPLPEVHQDSSYKNAQKGSDSEEKLINNMRYMIRVIQYFEEWNKTEDETGIKNSEATSIVVKVLLLKTELAKKKRSETESEPVDKTLSDIQEIMDHAAPDTKKGNKVNWTQYMEILINNVNTSFNLSESSVLIGSMPYFIYLAKLLKSTPQTIIEWYLWWELVSALAPHTDRIMRKQYNLWYMEMYSAIKYFKRSERCLEMVKALMPWPLSYLMIKDIPITETLNEAKKMMDDIRKSFITLVEGKDWINHETKTAALEKAKAVNMYFGHPSWLLDSKELDEMHDWMIFEESEYLWTMIKLRSALVKEILEQVGRPVIEDDDDDNDEWEGTYAFEVNAFYSETSNSIIVPAGILRFPFFNLGLQSMNYGALGYLLGHELTHGFDTNGRKRDKYGNKNSWWSESMEQEYEKRSDCFTEQYDAFSVRGNKVNGTLTLAENIADNGGIHETIVAYKKYEDQHGEESKLVGLESYTQEQLLYISFAHMWCHSPGYRYGEIVLDDEHSPKEFRVIGSLQNSKQFSEVWGCPVGSPMNPEKKCTIW